jgi:hypothetical protein
MGHSRRFLRVHATSGYPPKLAGRFELRARLGLLLSRQTG